MNTLCDGLSRTLGAVGKKVVGLEDHGAVLKIQARNTVRSAPCPACRRWSNRIHGTYFRRLAERPSLEQQVVLEIEMRRFKCTVASCPRRGRCAARGAPGLSHERSHRASGGTTG